mmetsp:Transcript_136/g.291  ORF Transcript_136/g.291 Transcript_136/m.291 type:complete len:290 (-) Transcript_136:336-1205(-)
MGRRRGRRRCAHHVDPRCVGMLAGHPDEKPRAPQRPRSLLGHERPAAGGTAETRPMALHAWRRGCCCACAPWRWQSRTRQERLAEGAPARAIARSRLPQWRLSGACARGETRACTRDLQRWRHPRPWARARSHPQVRERGWRAQSPSSPWPRTGAPGLGSPPTPAARARARRRCWPNASGRSCRARGRRGCSPAQRASIARAPPPWRMGPRGAPSARPCTRPWTWGARPRASGRAGRPRCGSWRKSRRSSRGVTWVCSARGGAVEGPTGASPQPQIRQRPPRGRQRPYP